MACNVHTEFSENLLRDSKVDIGARTRHGNDSVFSRLRRESGPINVKQTNKNSVD
jgi:hypothetical protein